MARVNLTPALRREYERLFDTCTVKPTKVSAVESLVDSLEGNRARYETVGSTLGVPWPFIAVIHNMESGQRFTRHLHNGDPLTARTTHVPAGRPKDGDPPFTWEASAIDAISMKGIGADSDWSLAGTLHRIEGYNGFGYRQYHPHVLTPYLWSFSNHYTSGKYVADGTWSDTAVSAQCGAAVLLRRMAERGLASFADQPPVPDEAAPAVSRYSTRLPRNAEEVEKAKALQTWLSTFPGIFLKPDGVAGPNTSAAYRKVTGHYLPGDPRT